MGIPSPKNKALFSSKKIRPAGKKTVHTPWKPIRLRLGTSEPSVVHRDSVRLDLHLLILKSSVFVPSFCSTSVSFRGSWVLFADILHRSSAPNNYRTYSFQRIRWPHVGKPPYFTENRMKILKLVGEIHHSI